jgi:hypothetical protein
MGSGCGSLQFSSVARLHVLASNLCKDNQKLSSSEIFAFATVTNGGTPECCIHCNAVSIRILESRFVQNCTETILVCSENIHNWRAERFTPLVLIETGNAGRLDKASLGVLSPGGA